MYVAIVVVLVLIVLLIARLIDALSTKSRGAAPPSVHDRAVALMNETADRIAELSKEKRELEEKMVIAKTSGNPELAALYNKQLVETDEALNMLYNMLLHQHDIAKAARDWPEE